MASRPVHMDSHDEQMLRGPVYGADHHHAQPTRYPPHVCDACKARAIEAARQVEQDERECQEQQEVPPAPKAGGWLGRRLRS
jgi:hypothetical protein